MYFKLISYFNRNLRKFLLGDFRQKKISEQIISKILTSTKKKKIKVLDFGSGFFKPSLASLISENLINHNMEVVFYCADLYSNRELKKLNKSSIIKYVHVSTLKNIKKKYDYCIISDTLHHIEEGVENLENLSKILLTLKKKSNYLIIKDHYEFGFISRKLLQILDFFGNYQNKTNLPKKYFTKKVFKKLIKICSLEIVSITENKKYYPWFFILFNSPKLHFVALLK